MALTVKVDNNSGLDFSIPFTPNGNTTPANIIVNWGDNIGITSVPAGETLSSDDNFNYTYDAPGTYTITITSDQTDETQKQIPEIRFTSRGQEDRLISIDTPLLNMGQEDLSSCFYGCTNLNSIPEGLFAKNTKATRFEYCFYSCTNLKSIPEGLFAQNTKATDFTACFQNCTNLVLNEKIFSTDEPPYNRFSGKNMYFNYCFSGVGSALAPDAAGKAPDLWNYDTSNVTWNTSQCFSNSTNLSNWSEIPDNWK